MGVQMAVLGSYDQARSPSVLGKALRRLTGLTVICATLLQACGGSDEGTPFVVAAPADTITVQNVVEGKTLDVVGYNLAHATTGSNAKDWLNYSDVKNARVFMSIANMKKGVTTDPITNTSTAFLARKQAFRTTALADADFQGSAADITYLKLINSNLKTQTLNDTNTYQVGTWFPELRDLGVDILISLTASASATSGFPLTLAADKVAPADNSQAWQLWRHYYATAFILARDYDIRRYSMFNEPNGWVSSGNSWTTSTASDRADEWALRLRICSDAIQAAINDVNTAKGKTLVEVTRVFRLPR